MRLTAQFLWRTGPSFAPVVTMMRSAANDFDVIGTLNGSGGELSRPSRASARP